MYNNMKDIDSTPQAQKQHKLVTRNYIRWELPKAHIL